MSFDEYDVSQSLIFHDVSKEQIDYSEGIKEFAFGFKWDGEYVDMLDNEFIHVNFDYEHKISQTEKHYDEIGFQECIDTSHLLKYYSKEAILKKFGMVYCSGPLSKDHNVLQG